jgi:hypothetical protein
MRIKITAYSIMSNKYHIIVCIDRDKALQWTDEEVMDCWCELFNGNVLINRWRSEEVLAKAEQMVINPLIETYGQRLFDISWFMVAPTHPCAPRHSHIPKHRVI